MGRRYQAILRSLGVPVQRHDVPGQASGVYARDLARYHDVTGIIIASPTNTHADYVRGLALLGLPILCEKPLSTDLATVAELLRVPGPLAMMAQYQCLDHGDTEGDTAYDFYHSGSDGLAWDCIQLLGLARGPVSLKAESPIWRCTLNGRRLSLDDVGTAYVDFVAHWLQDPDSNRAETLRWHQRAAEWRGNDA